jgi:hypothetical protein
MKVRDGRVLKKHNWRLDPGDYRALSQDEIRLDRRRPPEGSRHLITIAELRRFLALLPDWDEVAVGLDAIVLDSATDCAGWCGPGVVAVCAWDHDLWEWWSADMEHAHRHILDLLAVERVPITESPSMRNSSTTSQRSACGSNGRSARSRCAGRKPRRARTSCSTSCPTSSDTTTTG